MAIGEAAGAKDEQVRLDQKTQPATHGAQKVDPFGDRQIRIHAVPGKTGNIGRRRPRIRAIGASEALKVRLKACDPAIGELPIVTELDAANEAIGPHRKRASGAVN